MRVVSGNKLYFYNHNDFSNDKIQKSQLQIQNKFDNVSFGSNYEILFDKLLKTDMKTLKNVQDSFDKIFSTVINAKSIIKTDEFHFLRCLYDVGGYLNMMHELWQPKKVPLARELYKNLVECENTKSTGLVLAHSNGKNILELDDMQLLLRADNSAPSSPSLSFYLPDKKARLGFSVQKNGDYSFESLQNGTSIETLYYPSTWNKKRVVVNNSCSQEVIYYNKAGDKSFWKNLFRGGVVTF